MNRQVVAWEAYATFNPAAGVRDGKIYVLCRAEDANGEMRISGHTSRIGLAESTDGVRFTRRGEPVLCSGEDTRGLTSGPATSRIRAS